MKRKRIYIKESHIHKMVLESVRGYLTEGRHTKINKKASEVVRQKYPDMSDEEIKEYLGKVDHVFFGGDIKDTPLFKLKVPFTAEILDKGYDLDNAINDENIKRMRNEIRIVRYLCDQKTLDASEVGSSGSYKEFIDRYGKIISDNSNVDLTEKSKNTKGKYTIERLDTLESAAEYGDYSGLINDEISRICYTQGKTMWDSFTNKGINTMYVCLKDGWEELEPVHNPPVRHNREGNPYDEYGLSMIFVIVDPDGVLYKSNTRWNHEAFYGQRDCDEAFTKSELENLVGMRFEDAFPARKIPSFLEMVEEAYEKLRNTNIPIKDIFDDYNKMTNSDGMVSVCIRGMRNIVTPDREFLLDQWFNVIEGFDGYGLARVILLDEEGGNDKWNYVRKDGTKLLESDVDYITSFNKNSGLAKCRVYDDDSMERDQYEYLVDQNGNKRGKDYYTVTDYHNGIFVVGDIIDNKNLFNIINGEGRELCKRWYDKIEDFDPIMDIMAVGLSDEGSDDLVWNLIDRNGNELCKDWYYHISSFQTGFYSVVKRKDGENVFNLIDIHNGFRELCKNWYHRIKPFEKSGFALVSNMTSEGPRHNYIRSDGTEVLKCWYEGVTSFTDLGYARVSKKINGKQMMNVVNKRGYEVLPSWYTYVCEPISRPFIVSEDGKTEDYVDPVD